MYFTCGQVHSHEVQEGKVWDKDSVVQVTADCEDDAVSFMLDMFGNEWASWYFSKENALEYSPNGIVAVYDVTENTKPNEPNA